MKITAITPIAISPDRKVALKCNYLQTKTLHLFMVGLVSSILEALKIKFLSGSFLYPFKHLHA